MAQTPRKDDSSPIGGGRGHGQGYDSETVAQPPDRDAPGCPGRIRTGRFAFSLVPEGGRNISLCRNPKGKTISYIARRGCRSVHARHETIELSCPFRRSAYPTQGCPHPLGSMEKTEPSE